jgi:hypothetical protein
MLQRVTSKYYDVIDFDSVKAEMHGDIAITYGRYIAHTTGGTAPDKQWFLVWFERCTQNETASGSICRIERCMVRRSARTGNQCATSNPEELNTGLEPNSLSRSFSAQPQVEGGRSLLHSKRYSITSSACSRIQ